MRNVGNCAACNILFDLFTTLRHLGLGSADSAAGSYSPELWSLYLLKYSWPSFEHTTGIFDPGALIAGAIENPDLVLEQHCSYY